MSSLGNKKIMAKNLRYYIEKSGKERRELAEIWGFPYSTVSEWVNGKKYPRIDRIEIMADYFGILKSDLIEEKTTEEKDNDIMADVIVRMRTDKDFLTVVATLYKYDAAKIKSVADMLGALATLAK